MRRCPVRGSWFFWLGAVRRLGNPQIAPDQQRLGVGILLAAQQGGAKKRFGVERVLGARLLLQENGQGLAQDRLRGGRLLLLEQVRPEPGQFLGVLGGFRSVSHFDYRQQLPAPDFRLIVLVQLFVATGQGVKNHVCIGMGIIEPLNASR